MALGSGMAFRTLGSRELDVFFCVQFLRERKSRPIDGASTQSVRFQDWKEWLG